MIKYIEHVENILLTTIWCREYTFMRAALFYSNNNNNNQNNNLNKNGNIVEEGKGYEYGEIVFFIMFLLIGFIPLLAKHFKYYGPFICNSYISNNSNVEGENKKDKINQVIQKNTGIGIGTILIPYSVLSILSSSSSFDNNNTYLLFLFTCTIGMSLISFFKYCIHFAIGKLLLEENNRNNMIRYYSSEALSLLTTCYILQTVTGSFGKMNVHSNAFFQFAFVLTIYNLICMFIVKYLYNSFSKGETMMMSQITTIFFVDFIHFVYVKQEHTFHFLLNTAMKNYNGNSNLAFIPYIAERSESMICIQYMIIVTMIIGITTTIIMQVANTKCNAFSSSNFLILFYSLIVGQYGISIFLSKYMFYDGEIDIFTWMIHFVFYTKESGYTTLNMKNIIIVAYWFVILIVGMYIISKYGDYLSNNINIIKRKLFHVLAILLFVPISYVNIELLNVALGVAFSLIVLIEFIRLNDTYSMIGLTISKYLNENTDERDQGQLILTHMYLLLGCSIPLWIGSMFLFDQHSYYQKLQQQEENNAYLTSSLDTGIIYVCLLSGIVSVGVGDAVGSIVGKTSDEKYKIKWPNSNKSLQGTLAMTLAVLMCNVFIYLYSNILFALYDNGKGTITESHHYTTHHKKNLFQMFIPLLFVSFAVSLLEACTLQIDNIVLPLFLYSLVRLTRW